MIRQRVPLGWVFVRLVLISLFATTTVVAAEDLEHARAMFREALLLEVAGDWATALAKFQEVGNTRLTPQVRYHLARCKEHLGRLTEALGDYRVAEVEARAASLSETAEIERARRDLEARVPTLILRSRSLILNVRVELDGIAIGNAMLNRPMVLNPGSHQVTLRNATDAVRTLLINAEEGKTVDVDLQLYDGNLLPLPRNETPQAHADKVLSSGTPAWAYWAVGSGTASIAASAILFVVRESAKDELTEKCTGNLCPEALRGVQTRGEVASVVAPIALGVGVAAIGAGLWGIWGGARQPSVSRRQRDRSAISAVAWPGGCGVNIAAAF